MVLKLNHLVVINLVKNGEIFKIFNKNGYYVIMVIISKSTVYGVCTEEISPAKYRHQYIAKQNIASQ